MIHHSANLCLSTSHLYSRSDIRDIFNTYVSTKELINGRDQQYINVGEDLPLFEAVSIKNEDGPEFLKRDDALKRIKANMQSWHEVQRDGDDPIRKYVSIDPLRLLW